MRADIERVLITREAIAVRVQELAERITADHSVPDGVEGPEITIVPILTGAMIFCADLVRHIPFAMKIGMLTVSSYPGVSLRTQGAQLLGNQLGDVRGRHVLIVDDILDSGGTINLIVPIVRELGAASVRSCVLLRKDRPEAKATHVDYWGFEIPDEFVVGYGLDYDNYYRNLPYIGTLKQDAIDRGGLFDVRFRHEGAKGTTGHEEREKEGSPQSRRGRGGGNGIVCNHEFDPSPFLHLCDSAVIPLRGPSWPSRLRGEPERPKAMPRERTEV